MLSLFVPFFCHFLFPVTEVSFPKNESDFTFKSDFLFVVLTGLTFAAVVPRSQWACDVCETLMVRFLRCHGFHPVS